MLVLGLFKFLLVTCGSIEIPPLPHFQSSVLLLSLVLFVRNCVVCSNTRALYSRIIQWRMFNESLIGNLIQGLWFYRNFQITEWCSIERWRTSTIPRKGCLWTGVWKMPTLLNLYMRCFRICTCASNHCKNAIECVWIYEFARLFAGGRSSGLIGWEPSRSGSSSHASRWSPSSCTATPLQVCNTHSDNQFAKCAENIAFLCQ